MPEPSWKRHERKAAADLGGSRNPLSGRLSGHTSGDVIHASLYIECKYSKFFPVLRLMGQVEKNAAAARKLPILILEDRRFELPYYLLRGDHLLRFLSLQLGSIEETFYEEVRKSRGFAIGTLMRHIESEAAAEKKTPVLALQQKFQKHRYYIIRQDHLLGLLRHRRRFEASASASRLSPSRHRPL